MFRKGRNRFASSSSVVANKGLLNKPGDNNCFLNSAIQVLWHLDVFRKNFRQLNGHSCMGASCIFCALKDIFQQFQYSKDEALPPTLLRSALAETFQQQSRFQLGLMDDAAECFENILLRIHVHIGNTMREDVCTAPHCIPHQKFGLSLVEQCVCQCGATSEPLTFIEMVHYVSASALREEDVAMRIRYGTSDQKFGRVVRVASSWGDMRSCPSDCGAQIEMRKVLMNCPDVVSIGIVWDSAEPQVKDIISLVHALGTTLKLTDLFHTVVDERALRADLYLVGMVCYYGKHYSTFFFHTKLRKWVYFDDAQVSEVGKRWSNVISKCIKGHHQPLLLLYSNPNSSSISTSSAPTITTMLPGYTSRARELLSNSEAIEEELFQQPTNPPLDSKIDTKFTHDLKMCPKTNPTSKSDHKSGPGLKIQQKLDTYLKTSPKKAQPQQKAEREKKVPKSTVQLPDPTARENPPTQPRKPMFQWNMTSSTSDTVARKVGHYTEPSPAQWSKPVPYPVTQKKLKKEVQTNLPQEQRTATDTESIRDNLSIKEPSPIPMKRVVNEEITHNGIVDVDGEREKEMNRTEFDSTSDKQSSDTDSRTDDVDLEIEEKCQSLLRDSDELMSQSNSADQLMDYSSALQLCLEATRILESVMLVEGVPVKYLMSARMKHGKAINKGVILQRRKNLQKTSTSGGTRQSMTEADQDISAHQMHHGNFVNEPPTNGSIMNTNHVNRPHNHGTFVKETRNHRNQSNQPQNREVLMDSVQNDKKGNLIDLEKRGITNFQHQVDQLFQSQKIRGSKPAFTNTNNNTNNNINSDVENHSGNQPNDRTKIFVWRGPENEGEKIPSKTPVLPETSAQNPVPNFRSKTPTLPQKEPNHSQRRRSKTPTPRSKKSDSLTRSEQNYFPLAPPRNKHPHKTDPGSTTSPTYHYDILQYYASMERTRANGKPKIPNPVVNPGLNGTRSIHPPRPKQDNSSIYNRNKPTPVSSHFTRVASNSSNDVTSGSARNSYADQPGLTSRMNDPRSSFRKPSQSSSPPSSVVDGSVYKSVEQMNLNKSNPNSPFCHPVLCSLCGLVYVQTRDKYCQSCAAYLSRFQPSQNKNFL